jgi:threonine dehydrogenase-like Zn-dependent dehydrogenase
MGLPFRFVGTSHPYRNLRGTCKWGSFYVLNESRSGRKRPLHPGDCPFCGMAKTKSVGLLNFAGENYLVVGNSNRIVERQILIVPALVKDSRGRSNHRLDLNAHDVGLALNLCRQGFRGMSYKPSASDSVECHPDVFEQPWACYVNAFPGTGRSVAHLHINCVPAHYVPLLSNNVAPWQICSSSNGSTLSRLADVCFYAIAIENADDHELGATVAELHKQMNDWELPYNFAAYPFRSQEGSSDVKIAIVPRDQEYCEAADQRIAGLEFLTGVLIPGTARRNSMDTIQRDRAFLQATLKSERQLQLERLLRGLHELPPPGRVVRARTRRSVRKAVVESNNALISSPQAVNDTTSANSSELSSPGKRMSFGKVDSRYWYLPPRLSLPCDFNTRRLNANVLVRITRASICQSDRRVLAQTKPSELSRGWALGHEGGGYIVDPGPWVDDLAAGEKVVILPHLSCGECEPCHRYMSNLCSEMRHLGFHLNGNLADLMAFPYQCVLPVGDDFPDDALPLVEPLACVLRALFRIRHSLNRIADISAGHRKEFLTIFGAGPMGCLAALAARRKWSEINIRMIEPNATRHRVVFERGFANEVLERVEPDQQSAVSFVASSKFEASVDAVEDTEYGGTVMLFSGINTDEQSGGRSDYHGKNLEDIHRSEKVVIQEDAFGDKRVRLIGSSGYILDDVERAIEELKKHYRTDYIKVQNVEVDGLPSDTAVYCESGTHIRVKFRGKAVETLLSPRGVDDPDIARALKVIIRM